MAKGLKRYLFETKAIASGGKIQLTCKELEKGKAIHRIEVVADCAFTQGAAPATVYGREMMQLVKELRLSKRHIMLGAQLGWQAFLTRGRRASLPAAFLGVAGNVFSRKIRYVLDFYDRRAKRPDAACPLSDFLKDEPLSLSIESVGVAGATVAASCTFVGNVYAIAYVADATPGRLPSILCHEYVPWTGKRIVLDGKGRSIVDLFLFKQDGTAFTAAELATISASVDGVPYDSLPGVPADLTFAFNEDLADTNNVEVDTVAGYTPAGMLTQDPGVAAGAGAGVAPEIVPVFYGRPGYKILELPQADSQVVLTCTGTLSDFIVGVRYLEHRTEDQRQRAGLAARIQTNAFRVRDDDGRLTTSGRAAAVMPLDHA